MKVLITGAFQYTEEQWKKLKNMEIEIKYLADERGSIDFDVDDIEYVICNGLFLYHNIEKFKNLKYIQVTSAGLDRLPMDYINKNNIQIYNARGVYSIPIAEWTILKILETYKKSKVFYKQQDNHEWKKQRDLTELNEKTACIIGYGSIGCEIAKRLKVFNVNINIVDIRKPEENSGKYYSIEKIDDAISISDIVILALPLNEKTKYIINKDKLKLMKKNSILINLSRGKILNEFDLIEELEKGKFAGVVLDVFEEEPLEKASKLWNFDNVLITPHNAFVGENNNKRMFEVILNNLKGVKNR